MYLYYIIICVGVLPAGGVSHVAPVNPPTQVHSAVPSASTSAQVPPLLHGLGLQAKSKMHWIVVEYNSTNNHHGNINYYK